MTGIQSLTVILARLVFGLLAACFLGFIGFFVGWAISPGGAAISTPVLVSTIGVIAGLGGFAGWLKPDVARLVIFLGLCVALAGGVAGSWLSFLYGEMFQPERSFEWTSPQGPRMIVTVVGAGVGANLLASLFYLYRLWRYKEE